MATATRSRPRLSLPKHSMVEREFTVVYSRLGCDCEHCRREKTIQAFSHVDARSRFLKAFPLADVILVK